MRVILKDLTKQIEDKYLQGKLKNMHKFDNSLGYMLNIAAAINKNALYSVLAPYEVTPEQYFTY